MRILTILSVSSIALTNIALASNGMFAGGSVGYSQTKWEADDSEKKSGVKLGLEGGREFKLNDQFALSAELFADYNAFKYKVSEGSQSLEVNQNFFFGAQSRAIFTLNSNVDLYGKLGLGVATVGTELKTLIGNASETKYKLAGKVGVGAAYKVHENVKIFAEAEYTMIAKEEELKTSNMAAKIGARYYF